MGTSDSPFTPDSTASRRFLTAEEGRQMMQGASAVDPTFSGARAFAAEGARVGIVTCLTCGAAVFLDPADKTNPMSTHIEWHRTLIDVTHSDE